MDPLIPRSTRIKWIYRPDFNSSTIVVVGDKNVTPYDNNSFFSLQNLHFLH